MSSKKIPDNVALWNSVQATDPQFTKTFTRAGGFSGTAINPCYVTRWLTEVFGPVGNGWKFVIDEERYVEGHVLRDGLSRAVIHVIRGHIKYFHDDGNGGDWYDTGPQFGQTTFVGELKDGRLYTDEEAPKKSVTDCLTKCAVLLGFSSDIHLGLWDANKYINDPGAVASNPFRAPAADPPATEYVAPASGQIGAQPVTKPTAKPKADKAPKVDPAPIEIEANSARQLGDVTTLFTDEKANYSRDGWINVCKSVAKRLREIGDPNDPYYNIVKGWLQKEADEFNAATTAPAAEAPKKRGRPPKKKIDESTP